MKTEIETVQQFIKSLGPAQRRYFIQREANIQTRLQTSLREFGRGISEVSALSGESLDIVLAEADGLLLPTRSRE